jgi:hypothetical protein
VCFWTNSSRAQGLWLVTFTYFVFRIAVPKYRHTLWSWTSGREVAQANFLGRESDEKKFLIFRSNRLVWEADIGKDVRAWTLSNWERWDRDKPEWFSPRVVARVPDEYIPPRFLGGLGGARRERRGSAAGSVRESLRASVRGRGEEGAGGAGGVEGGA